MSLHEHIRRVERHGGDSKYPPTNTHPLCCAGGKGIIYFTNHAQATALRCLAL